MKGRGVLRRRRARGFTLMELMVVVMLVAILAMLAVPTMSGARNDRIAFNYARVTSELFHNARARASGRGAAHLVVFSSDSTPGASGTVFVFEALDGGAPPAGPNPSSGCRSSSQWTWATGFKPGDGKIGELKDASFRSRLVDFLNTNSADTKSIQSIEEILMTGYPVLDDGTVSGAVKTIAMCITPNGTTFVGTGASPTSAVDAMAASTESFKGTLYIDVARHRGGVGQPVGITRRVILSGAGAPRIKSQ